jgi:uncharacterized membrane protein
MRRKEILRVVLSVSLIIVGILHFVRDDQFVRIVPDFLPAPLSSVYISGVFEILGAIGLPIPSVSVAAAWGLIALFIAVFPANINQAINSIPIDGIPDNPLFYWLRLPCGVYCLGLVVHATPRAATWKSDYGQRQCFFQRCVLSFKSLPSLGRRLEVLQALAYAWRHVPTS